MTTNSSNVLFYRLYILILLNLQLWLDARHAVPPNSTLPTCADQGIHAVTVRGSGADGCCHQQLFVQGVLGHDFNNPPTLRWAFRMASQKMLKQKWLLFMLIPSNSKKYSTKSEPQKTFLLIHQRLDPQKIVFFPFSQGSGRKKT